jgi:hypothetical protein
MKKPVKPTKPTFQDLENEKRKLYVTNPNSERLKEIIKKLDFLYWGIK